MLDFVHINMQKKTCEKLLFGWVKMAVRCL
jgi:hypothetical protein